MLPRAVILHLKTNRTTKIVSLFKTLHAPTSGLTTQTPRALPQAEVSPELEKTNHGTEVRGSKGDWEKLEQRKPGNTMLEEAKTHKS